MKSLLFRNMGRFYSVRSDTPFIWTQSESKHLMNFNLTCKDTHEWSYSVGYLEEAREQGADARVAASVLDALDATDVLERERRDRRESPRFTTPLPGKNGRI